MPQQNQPWIFVDLDGTLVDDLVISKRIFFQVGNEFGLHLSAEDFARCNGLSLKEIFEYFAKKTKGSPSFKIFREIYARKLKDLYYRLKPRNKSRAVLKKLRAQAWRCALVTSAPRKFALLFLQRNNMQTIFDFIVSGDEVRRAKPHPEIYKLAKKRAGKGCIAVLEDSFFGIQSAKEAG
jgi:beta-phosphoglucomutase